MTLSSMFYLATFDLGSVGLGIVIGVLLVVAISALEGRVMTDSDHLGSADRVAQLMARLSHAVDDARALGSTPLADRDRVQVASYLAQVESALRLDRP